jgi:mycothiol synthase
MDDLSAATAVMNAWSQDRLGVSKFTQDETCREWTIPGFNLQTDTRLVFAPDGQPVGYEEVWDLNDPHVRLNGWGRVHPAHEGQGIGSYLLDWAEQRGGQAVSRAPVGARVSILFQSLSNDPASQALFENAGLQLVRHSLRMIIDLDEPPPAPQWPAGIALRPFAVGQDERAVVHAVREAFRDHWGFVESPFETEFERWTHFMAHEARFNPALWYLAYDADRLAGFSLCYDTAWDNPDLGWVGTLGVLRPWRRRGLGLALLRHSFDLLYQRGKRKIGLGVDAQNLTGAIRLYTKAGMYPDPLYKFCMYEKELRPGQELSLQSL